MVTMRIKQQDGTIVDVPLGKGADGKSAYEYAQDGGYTGTEAEFTIKLSREYLTEETDPTVPSWAKASSKPSYNKSEIGLQNVDNVKQYSASNPPPYPVTSVNDLTGVVNLGINNIPNLSTTLDNKANKSQGIFYIEGSGTTDTTNKVATWTGSHSEISEYYPGLMIAYKIGTAGSTTTTLNINNLGAIPVVKNASTAISTNFAVKSIIFLVYTIDSTTAYWKAHDYDANTRNSVGDYRKNNTKLYFVGTASSDNATASSYATSYTNSNVYIDTDNVFNSIEGFKGDLIGTATKAAQDANGNVITNTYETKTNASAKLTEAKAYTDTLVAEKVSKTELSLGIASDGLIYLFIDGVPTGTGIPQGNNGDVFGYVDENNTIVLTGALADGTYNIKYEMEDGSVIDIGTLALSYLVTNNLTNCINNNSETSVANGGSYSATIAVSKGYRLVSISVKMGGTDITSSVVNGNLIIITNVTGDIIITALAEMIPEDGNMVNDSIDADGNIYNGIGYKNGVYISASSAGAEKEASGFVSTGFIPNVLKTTSDSLYIMGAAIDMSTDTSRYIGFTNITTFFGAVMQTYWATRFTIETLGTNYYKLTPKQSYIDVGYDQCEYFRLTLKGTGENLIVSTEPINIDINNYPNQIPISTDTDGSVFNDTGYMENRRINSSGTVGTLTNTSSSNPAFVTGFIPVTEGNRILLQNCYIDSNTITDASIYGQSTDGLNVSLYDSSKTKVGAQINTWNRMGSSVSNPSQYCSSFTTDENGYTTQFSIKTGLGLNIGFIRLTLACNNGYTPADAVVAVI